MGGVTLESGGGCQAEYLSGLAPQAQSLDYNSVNPILG